MRYNWLIVDYNHAYYGNHQIHHSPDHIKDAAQTAVHCWPKNWEKKWCSLDERNRQSEI